MSLRPYHWSWEQKTEEERRHTLRMRIQVEPWSDVCYDYLLASAEGVDITAEEAHALKWLSDSELGTVMNIASVLRKARNYVPEHEKEPPVRHSSKPARRRSGYDR